MGIPHRSLNHSFRTTDLYVTKGNPGYLLYYNKKNTLYYIRIFFFVCFKKGIYLSERVQKQGERQGEGEAGSLLSKEPDVGLNPKTLAS